MNDEQPRLVQQQEEHVENVEPPLTPLEPVVVVHEPQLLAVTATSGSFSWPPATWHLPDHDDQQAEYQQMVIYSLEYELQVQQVDVGPPSADASVEQLLQQVFPALKPTSWRAVAHITGSDMPDMQQVSQQQHRSCSCLQLQACCFCCFSCRATASLERCGMLAFAGDWPQIRTILCSSHCGYS